MQTRPRAAVPFSIAADGLRLRVRVSPRAAASRIDGLAREWLAARRTGARH